MPLVCPKCQRTLLLRHSVQKGINEISDRKLTAYCEGQLYDTCDYEFEVVKVE